jgi:hypothetical protein
MVMARKPLHVVIIVLFAFICSILISGCENRNGERTVRGKVPLEDKTVEAEQMCNSFPLPAGSNRLETEITSKSYMGSVTNRYSTDYDCQEIDDFFRTFLLSQSWKQARREKSGFLAIDTYSTFKSDPFLVEVWCTQMKDFRGVREYYVTCHWE